MKNIICAAVCFFSLFVASAQSGTLDKTFSGNGKAFYDSFTGECAAIALQKDGKIITGGFYVGIGTGFLIARFNTDGSLDESFGDGGKTIITNAEGSKVSYLIALAVQADDKIIACGIFYPSSESGNIGLVRLNADGILDNSFDGNGIVNTSLGDDDVVSDMVLQEDGKIVVTGEKGVPEGQSTPEFVLRYLSDGSLDKSFGDKGKVFTPNELSISSVDAVTVQTDGKIIIAGRYFGGSLFLIRYLPDGKLDFTFDEDKDGIAGIRFEENDVVYSSIFDIAMQPDGKIVAAATAGYFDYKMAVVRFNSDGSVDSAFGDKIGYSVLESGYYSKAAHVDIESDNKIVLTGIYLNGEGTGFGAVKYNEDGSLDSSFGLDGVASAGFSDIDAAATTGILQKDGKILVGGQGYPAYDNDFNRIALVRFSNDAALPITYSKFSATQTKEYVTLNWQTTTELNNNYFAVERSSNAVNYTTVAQVNSVATGAAVKDYFYTDKLPLAGSNYYRLKQVDKDGKFSYSKTVSIGYLKPGSIQLFPNPAKDRLTVKGLNAAITSTIKVLDIQGKQLLQFTAKAAAYSFSIGSLAPGTYMVRVKDDNGTKVEKFVKQ